MAQRILRLRPWDEACGILHESDEEESCATISSNIVALPTDLINSLKAHLGKRIAVLRTDDQAEPYRWRLLD
jgi:hypothetical protein